MTEGATMDPSRLDGGVCEQAGRAASERMLARRPEWVQGQISPQDQPLLMGLTRLLQPRKVVEIGVASGWSGALFVDTLERNDEPGEYVGIDLSPRYYLDPERPTGAVIDELCPPGRTRRRLLLGRMAVDVIDEVGPGVDLAFIDGDHHHPWALLDLLTLLPVLEPQAAVLMHDLSLSTFERHQHRNRGPKYLYECWPHAKLHSSQVPPMIGAIVMPRQVDDTLLTLLLDTLHTPWEVNVPATMAARIAARLAEPFGADWAARFGAAMERMNAPAAKPAQASTDPFEGCLTLARQEADPATRRERLQHLAGLFPQRAAAWHHLSVAERAAGQPVAALASAERALALEPRAPDLLSFHGQLLMEAGQLSAAEPPMREAILLAPAQATYHLRLAQLLQRRGQLPAAREASEQALLLAPGRGDILALIRQLAPEGAGPPS